MLTLRNRPPLPPSGLLYNAEDPCHLTMKAASRPDDHAACTGLWISVQRTSDIDSRCRCLKSCAPMTEVGCTGHQHDWPERLGGVSALHPARSSTSWRAPQFPGSSLGIKNPRRAWFCWLTASRVLCSASPRLAAAARGVAAAPADGAGKAGFHGFGPVVRRVSAVARRPAARGRSGCPGRGPHRRAAGRPGRGRAAVSRPSGRRR